jgi:hypothetical protein
MYRCFPLDNTTLLISLTRTRMPLDEIHFLHNNSSTIRQNAKDLAPLAPILTAKNLYEIALSNQRTTASFPFLHVAFLPKADIFVPFHLRAPPAPTK